MRNPQDTEDAVQEAFLSTFQSIGSFREASSLYTRLYRIVCNHAFLKLRQEEFRIAYILKDVEKLSEDRVAEILGVSKPTMKNRVHRARLVIRKQIEEHFFKRQRR